MAIDIKITKNGYLEMYRRGNWRVMICPFSGNGLLCGDWCPLFNYRETTLIGPGNEGDGILKELFLCRTKYLISKVEYE